MRDSRQVLSLFAMVFDKTSLEYGQLIACAVAPSGN
jgi:hypothetical protein